MSTSSTDSLKNRLNDDQFNTDGEYEPKNEDVFYMSSDKPGYAESLKSYKNSELEDQLTLTPEGSLTPENLD